MVALLNTKVIDTLEIGKFVLNDNEIMKFVENNKIVKPSELVKEIIEMAQHISKESIATKKAMDNKDFSFCLSDEDERLSEEYQNTFDVKYNVWHATVIDFIWRFRKNLIKEV
jgi:uncharacterized protein YjaG (DUF416 family)